MSATKPDLLKPALIGGAVGALLSVVPPCCCLCCLNAVLGGVLAGVLYARRANAIGWYSGAEEGLTVGAIAGFVAGLLHAFASGLMDLASSAFLGGAQAELPADFPPPGMEWLGDVTRQLAELPGGVVFGAELCIAILIGTLFGILGGAIGVVSARRAPTVVPVGAGATPAWGAPGSSATPAPPPIGSSSAPPAPPPARDSDVASPGPGPTGPAAAPPPPAPPARGSDDPGAGI